MPREIVECLLTLPGTSVADALKELAGTFQLSKVVPEVLKNLAAGAMTARRAEPQVEEQEIEEYDEETEEDEVEEA